MHSNRRKKIKLECCKARKKVLYMTIDRLVLWVDRSVLWVDRSVLWVDRSVLCVDKLVLLVDRLVLWIDIKVHSLAWYFQLMLCDSTYR
jgi:hypothetical protein